MALPKSFLQAGARTGCPDSRVVRRSVVATSGAAAAGGCFGDVVRASPPLVDGVHHTFVDYHTASYRGFGMDIVVEVSHFVRAR